MTRVVEVEQVIATHRHEWRKWPDTDDRDYSSVLAERSTWTFKRGDVELRVRNRFYPVYSSYIAAGDLTLPIRFPVINNLSPPSQAVLEQQRKDLAAYSAAGCSSILWEHCHQCFPEVVYDLPSLFKLRTIMFGDDCPGSSDVKTFPVAASFNAIYYSMYIWNPDNGALTGEEYRRRGVAYQRFAPSAMSVGLADGLAESGTPSRRSGISSAAAKRCPTSPSWASPGAASARNSCTGSAPLTPGRSRSACRW